MPRLPTLWIPFAAAVVLLATLRAADEEVVRLPAVVVEEKALHAELARWSYARAAQCEVMTDLGPAVAAAIAQDLCVVAEYLRYSHPEADIPKRTPIRMVLDSGAAKTLFGAAAARRGFTVQRDAVGILVAAQDGNARTIAAFRRELVGSGFAHNASKLPLWYQLALRNIVADVRVKGTTVVAGEPPPSTPGSPKPAPLRLDELEAALRLRRDSPDYRDEARRAVLEQQATTFMQLCIYANRGVHARNLVIFILDPAATEDPSGAFKRAFGFDLSGIEMLVWEGNKRGRYSPMTVPCDIDATPTSRAAHPSDLDDFRYALSGG